MRSQIINSADDIDLSDVVVSSSLPVWLALSQYMPMFPAMLSEPFTAVRNGEVQQHRSDCRGALPR
nr:hypothetical protein [Enterobacter roggenkampii]